MHYSGPAFSLYIEQDWVEIVRIPIESGACCDCLVGGFISKDILPKTRNFGSLFFFLG